MKKSVHTPQYDEVRKKLIEMRKAAKLTHRQLADKLHREHSFVWRAEQGERRLDILEFYWVCNALGMNAADVYAELTKLFAELDMKNRRLRRVRKPKAR